MTKYHVNSSTSTLYSVVSQQHLAYQKMVGKWRLSQ